MDDPINKKGLPRQRSLPIDQKHFNAIRRSARELKAQNRYRATDVAHWYDISLSTVNAVLAAKSWPAWVQTKALNRDSRVGQRKPVQLELSENKSAAVLLHQAADTLETKKVPSPKTVFIPASSGRVEESELQDVRRTIRLINRLVTTIAIILLTLIVVLGGLAAMAYWGLYV